MKIKISDPLANKSKHMAQVTNGMLMVCLCDEDSKNVVSGKLLTGAEMCSKHPSVLKLESLVSIGIECLLFTEVDGEPVPLRLE